MPLGTVTLTVTNWSPLRFAGIANDRLCDPNGYPMPTLAYEYGLDKDVSDLDFSAFGTETRRMVYKPLVKFHLLFLFLRSGLKAAIGRGFCEDSPKITTDFFATEFYRVLDEQFMRAYADWLGEMADNMRSVHIFNIGGHSKNTGKICRLDKINILILRVSVNAVTET